MEFPQDEEAPLVERYVEVMQLHETEGFKKIKSFNLLVISEKLRLQPERLLFRPGRLRVKPAVETFQDHELQWKTRSET